VKLSARRLKDLHEKDLVTQADYEQVQAQLEQARRRRLRAKAALQNSRLDLERCTLLSPSTHRHLQAGGSRQDRRVEFQCTHAVRDCAGSREDAHHRADQ